MTTIVMHSVWMIESTVDTIMCWRGQRIHEGHRMRSAIQKTALVKKPGSRLSVSIFLTVVVMLIAGACASTGNDESRGTASGSGAASDELTDLQPDQAPSVLERLYAVEDLRSDFRQFRGIIEHKTVGLYTDRTRLTAMLDEAEAVLIEPLTELQFYRLLAPIVAQLRCGHSFISVSAGMEEHLRDEALFFSFSVRIFGDRLFVVEDSHGLGVAPGLEILTLNGMAAAELIHRITANVVTDGRDQGRPRHDSELWFAALYYSYVDTPTSFALELSPPGSDPVLMLEIPAICDEKLAKIAQAIVYDTANAPYSSAFSSSHAILKVQTFSYRKPKAFNAFLKDFFSELSVRQLDTLILDLRGNYGGSPAPTAELFKYLIDEPLPFFARNNPIYLAPWKKPLKPAPYAFHGKLYVLVDEAAFSMNSFLISLLKHHGIGTLVGSATAGGWACSDAARGATLGATGLRLKYSTQAFYTAVEGLVAGVGIEPDVLVEWTLTDHLEGRDPVFAAALVLAGASPAD